MYSMFRIVDHFKHELKDYLQMPTESLSFKGLYSTTVFFNSGMPLWPPCFYIIGKSYYCDMHLLARLFSVEAN